ncbi:hypothetical protein [Hoeflea sp.]|uniref:hypothetical protein n=1 Tax=Hoeflea sp. TaxID=1940281 RepID=UPI001984B231|nr:hypothetical protein [Hoeflea sp.]MBC7283164.1 hypothetical protein [Hoeflea sp.]
MTRDTARHVGARRIVAALLLICGSVQTALADTQPAYDRRIEEAAIRMLQPKLGDMRGALDLKAEDHLYPPLNERTRRHEEAAMPAALPHGVSQGSFIRY